MAKLDIEYKKIKYSVFIRFYQILCRTDKKRMLGQRGQLLPNCMSGLTDLFLLLLW